MSHHNSIEPTRRGIIHFQMWGPFRDNLIEEHRFYLDQGKNKLLAQFNNMEQESDEAAERWLEKRAQFFDPERDDPGADYENAYHEGIEYYRLLSEMRDQTRLSLVAGMFHIWDKQLRSWLVKETQYWHAGKTALQKIWAANFDEIASLLDAAGLANQHSQSMERLSACRYVVNVYKHGDGPAFETLKARHPEFLRDSLSGNIAPTFQWVDFTSLAVNDEQLDEFSQAICDFWRYLPLDVRMDDVDVLPAWFRKALAKG